MCWKFHKCDLKICTYHHSMKIDFDEFIRVLLPLLGDKSMMALNHNYRSYK